MVNGNGVDLSFDDADMLEKATLLPMNIPSRRFVNHDKILYRIYDKPGHFKLVEADSAHEAYEKSGIARPHKIERETFSRYLSLPPEMVGPDHGEGVDTNVDMSEEEETKRLVFDSIASTSIEDDITSIAFEEMAIGSLNRKEKIEDAPIEVIQQMKPDNPPSAPDPDVLPVDEPIVEKHVEPPVHAAAEESVAIEEEAELTPEQVEALLNS